ncbi:hypothetical protein SGHV089 [Glossina pallidipes salivary gland hypertrophy virus]|uniref:Uncharacterized protein n=1 Tax=Glossina hytrovirus (isolate Glossina pallidipes/Ethiopia/Seibersdorf/-) TaxID=379529 RepID=B0YLP3_GHVS|nr:hypothetical protein SGHV089 [Glossina pallidipes salivary gland hypertrophy virus]ABQ08862.1 hypothetical protein SGHV089 [Glossina pallidipes salivary gland hypertrophy virus]
MENIIKIVEKFNIEKLPMLLNINEMLKVLGIKNIIENDIYLNFLWNLLRDNNIYIIKSQLEKLQMDVNIFYNYIPPPPYTIEKITTEIIPIDLFLQILTKLDVYKAINMYKAYHIINCIKNKYNHHVTFHKMQKMLDTKIMQIKQMEKHIEEYKKEKYLLIEKINNLEHKQYSYQKYGSV